MHDLISDREKVRHLSMNEGNRRRKERVVAGLYTRVSMSVLTIGLVYRCDSWTASNIFLMRR